MSLIIISPCPVQSGIGWPSEACSQDQDRYGESLQYARGCTGEKGLQCKNRVKHVRAPNLRREVTRSRLMMSSPCLSVVWYRAMYLTCLQSIIVTPVLAIFGATQVEQDEHKYFASSFEDLVQLAKQEIILIQHLKKVQESLT